MKHSCLKPAIGAIVLLFCSIVQAEDGSVWQGVYSEHQAAEGKLLFELHCKACHADVPGQVGGHGPAPKVFGEDFEFRWLDSTVLDVLDVIRQTMPEAAPNSLSIEEYAALTAYILQLNGYPIGASPLDPRARQDLGNIYVETKPE
ncbi:MAG: mono/diheme cytochrome c family protein [Limisphaerales bacterium]